MFWTFFLELLSTMAWHEKKIQKGKKIQSLKNLLEFLPFCSNIAIGLKAIKKLTKLKNFEKFIFFFFISGTLNRLEDFPVNQNILWTTN